jgi:hypothetical protein
LNNTTVSGNRASDGGGIYATGRVILNNSTVSDNTGRGISFGGPGTLVLNNSSVSGNIADSAGGIFAGGNITLNNSTVSGNTANSGGGIYGGGDVTLNSSTVSGNRASAAGGGIYYNFYTGKVILNNSILAGNSAARAPDCLAAVESKGHSLLGDTSLCTFTSGTGDLINVDAKLGLLIGASGAPRYHPLLVDSPAINAGNPMGCVGSEGPLDTDQRGAVRAGRCDIGAYEYTPPGPATGVFALSGTPQRTPPFSAFALPVQAVVLDGLGSPVGGVTVTFSAPASGASGTFADSGTRTTTAVSDASGAATAATFTANSQGGSYTVTATVGGLAVPADFSLSNFGWYLAPAGNDENNCQTSATACATINGALGKVGFLPGDTILVAVGTYTGSENEVAALDKSVRILGGWNPAFTAQSGASTIDGQEAQHAIRVDFGATAILGRLIVQRGAENSILSNGDLTLDDTTVRGSTFGRGVDSGGFLTLKDSTVSGNAGGGIGGGIIILNNSIVSGNAGIGIIGGYVILNNSTVSDNSGSGVYGLNLVLNNTTVSGNLAGSSAGFSYGGGMYATGKATLNSSTVTGNRSLGYGGGIYSSGEGQVILNNSLLAGNVAPRGPDCYGSIDSSGYSLVGDTSECTLTSGPGDLTNVDARLGLPIGASGAPRYHPLLADSPAIDAGNPTGCVGSEGPLNFDQRGAARVGRCDIGAYEYTPAGPAAGVFPLSGTPQRTPPFSAFDLPVQAVVLDGLGSPVSGVTVTFSAPASGASGAFADSGTRTTTAVTDASGVATAATFTANSQGGSYTVTATVAGLAGPANFSLSNFGWYVATDGNDASDCQSAATTCATINGALGKPGFLAGDTLLVAIGEYTDGDTVAQLDTSVRILGGWNTAFMAQSGASTLDGPEAWQGVVTVSFGATAVLERIVVQNGIGSGVVNEGDLTLEESTIRDNTGFNGGGIFNSGILSLDGSTVSGNTASMSGGIYNSGLATLSHSTVSGNTTTFWQGGGFSNGGLLLLINSTVSGNTSWAEGGGIDNSGRLDISSSTITENTAGSSGGGIRAFGSVVMRNSILAGNSAYFGPDCVGTIDSKGYNLLGVDDDCTFYSALGDWVGQKASPVYAGLAPLADNGGPTATHALLPGSPAIDSGNPAGCTGIDGSLLTTDQRGLPRPVGPACDIGAFEAPFYTGPFTFTADNGPALPGKLLCDSAQPDCTGGADPHADGAHQHAADWAEFFSESQGRDSFDGAGKAIVSTVHYRVNYDNAFWNGQQVVYGDASGWPLADDIVAHEFTHGVTQYESNLFYYYQSGAINESFSDLWGEFVDQTNGSGNDSPAVKWLIGEDITDLGAIRSMSGPPAFGDPDRIKGPNYYTGAGDNGGVHTNSGVNNKAAYLMTDGGSFNGYTVSGLGISKVAAIYYEVQTGLLTSGADYRDLYFALDQACLNLIGGPEGITSGDCTEVVEATAATEMDKQPAAGFNPHAQICPGGYVVNPLFYDDLESVGGNWAVGVETGSNAWSISSFYATSGTDHLWGDDFFTMSDSWAAMNADTALPGGSQPYLHFNHAFGFEDPDFDGGFLEYSTNGGSIWVDAGPLFDQGVDYTGTIVDPGPVSGANPNRGHVAFIGDSHGYVSTRYDLAPLAGQSVRFRWRSSTDASIFDWGWFVDDVRIYTCEIPAPSAPSNVQASDGTYGNRVQVNWDAVGDATDYEVYRDTDAGGGTMGLIASPASNSYSDTAVSDLVTYYYWVKACNAGGCSGLSASDSGYADASASTEIFSDGFESGDTSAWSNTNTGGGDLTVCDAGAMNGTSYGLCIAFTTDKRKQVVDASPADESHYRARFYFDPNGLSLGNNEKIRLAQARTGMNELRPVIVLLRVFNGQYQIRLRGHDDLMSGFYDTAWYTISDAAHVIELDWQAASGPGANDGTLALYLDDVLKETLSGMDTDTEVVSTITVGFTSKTEGITVAGSMYLDEFVSDSDAYIGP